MTMIVQKDDPVLRETAKEVAVEDINSSRIKDVIRRMKEAMHAEDDAVAIAAPQIGVSLRIFVMSGKARLIVQKEEGAPNEGDNKMPPDEVYINPVLLKCSREKAKMDEGCLSVRYLYGQVSRSIKAQIEYHDENGKKTRRGAKGLIAQIYQHEADHLNGVLFTDKAENLVELSEKERKEWRKKNREQAN